MKCLTLVKFLLIFNLASAQETVFPEIQKTTIQTQYCPLTFRQVCTENASSLSSAYPSSIEDMFEELSALPPGPPDFAKVFEIGGNYGIQFL